MDALFLAPKLLLAAVALPASPLDARSSQALVGWFDALVLALLVVGFWLGRKRGMSAEFMDVIQWLGIVGGGAVLYGPVGTMLRATTGFGQLYSYLIAYLLVGVIVKTVCTLFKKSAGEKLLSSEVFGGFEYYLGMIAGVVRFACITVFLLAILHARLYTDAELKAQELEQSKNFESIRFPTLGTLQRNVFQGSFAGHFVHENAPFLLIEPTAPAASLNAVKQERDRQFNRSLGL